MSWADATCNLWVAYTVGMTEPSEAITSVDIEATPADVWEALTTKDGLADWMGEGSVVGRDQGDDLFVQDIVTGRPRRGVLDEVSPEHRLGYTWWPEADPEQATRVSITLTPCEVGTRVTVVETLPVAIGSPRASAANTTRAMAGATSCWSWRLALMTLASAMTRIQG